MTSPSEQLRAWQGFGLASGLRQAFLRRRLRFARSWLGRIGQRASRFLFVPPHLHLADPSVATDFLAGQIVLAGRSVLAGGRSVLDVAPPSRAFAIALHGFDWLRHFDASGDLKVRYGARQIVAQWLERRESGRLPDAEAPPVAVMPIVEQALPILPAATEASILSPMVASAKAAKAEDVWVPVKRPVLLYNLEAPDVEASSLVYRVAMRGKSARQDMLTWVSRGQAGAGKFKPAVHLVVERFEQTSPTFRPLYSDIANRAAEQGISIDRMTPPQEIQTKFGSGQVADAVLSTEQGPLGCLVFRQIDTIGLVFAGWYCGSAQRPADRVSLICFIDRLDLLGAGQDAALKKHFAGAERNRKSCAGARQSGRNRPPPFIAPVVFIQAGGLQGDTNSWIGRPATRSAAWMKGSRAWRSRAMLKLASAKSSGCSTWA